MARPPIPNERVPGQILEKLEEQFTDYDIRNKETPGVAAGLMTPQQRRQWAMDRKDRRRNPPSGE